MPAAYTVLNEFTGSNGVEIKVAKQFADAEVYLVGRRKTDVDVEQTHATASQEGIEALREFFQDALDQQIGRWRWPEDPDYVVYTAPAEAHEIAFGRGLDLIIFRESDGVMKGYCRAEDKGIEPAEHRTGFILAARSYLAAHPEPTPWHDAKPGEMWDLTVDGTERRYAAVLSSSVPDGHVRMFPVDDLDALSIGSKATVITAGRRIWPEVAA